VDIESIVIANPDQVPLEYPVWPPKWSVDLTHWWGRQFDPLLIARPVFWQVEIWIDVLFFGPYYAAAMYCFIKGKEWIRFPSYVYAATLLVNVITILAEELYGVVPARDPTMVVAANLAWILFPIYLIARLWPKHPFTRKQPIGSASLTNAAVLNSPPVPVSVEELMSPIVSRSAVPLPSRSLAGTPVSVSKSRTPSKTPALAAIKQTPAPAPAPVALKSAAKPRTARRSLAATAAAAVAAAAADAAYVPTGRKTAGRRRTVSPAPASHADLQTPITSKPAVAAATVKSPAKPKPRKARASVAAQPAVKVDDDTAAIGTRYALRQRARPQ
jgi:hypothetical protein